MNRRWRRRDAWMAFWDYSRCPWWYAPVAFAFRLKALIACGISTGHAVTGRYQIADDQACDCGYFAAVRTEWTPEASLADEYQDTIDRRGASEAREALAEALHSVLCNDDHELDTAAAQYEATRGGSNRYQRHADTIIRWMAAHMPTNGDGS